MNDFDLSHLIRAASGLQTIWQGENIPFCFIGGLAVHYWGEIRMTQDIDATVLTGFGNEQTMIERLWRDLTPRISNATEFARLNRVLLGQSPEGVPVDISLSGLPYEENVIQRSKLRDYGEGISLRICEASDLVILKAFADRPRDWQDIRGVLIRSAGQLDWQLVQAELAVLAELKEQPEIITRLQQLRSETNS